jgi:protein TonB
LNKSTPFKSALPQQGRIFALILFVSLVIHAFSYISIPRYRSSTDRFPSNGEKKMEPIKIKITERKEPEPDRRVVETPMAPTAPPEKATVLGAQDHKAKQEMKIKKEEIKSVKAANAGPKGTKEASSEKPGSVTPEGATQKTQISISGTVPLASPAKPRNAYENMLNSAMASMQGQIDAGFQEYIDEKATDGDHIDLNTQEYRYVGYFTTLRKSIELVWNYPLSAVRKGLQGTVNLEFTIHENGDVTQIKVLKTSGFQILDKAIVDAIKLASPFAPLPVGFGRKKLVITGAFNYVLS